MTMWKIYEKMKRIKKYIKFLYLDYDVYIEKINMSEFKIIINF